MLGQVKKAEDCIGPEVKKAVDALKNGEIIVLENVRFYPEEEKNVAEFAKKVLPLPSCLASLLPLPPLPSFLTAQKAIDLLTSLCVCSARDFFNFLFLSQSCACVVASCSGPSFRVARLSGRDSLSA